MATPIKAKKRKTVVYFKVNYSFGEFEFSQLLRDALSMSHPLEREWIPNAELNNRFLISDFKVIGNALTGCMIRFEQGRKVNAYCKPPDLNHSSKTEIFSPGKTVEGWNREVIDSMLFFAVLSNHVAIIQSSRIMFSHFEGYIKWLSSEILKKTAAFSLQRELSSKLNNLIAKKEIKSILMTNGLGFFSQGSNSNLNEGSEEAEKLETHPFILNPDIIDLLTKKIPNLKEILGGDSSKDIQCQLLLKIKKNKVVENQNLIKEMVQIFKPEVFDSFQVQFGDKTKLKGTELIVSNTFPIETFDGIPQNDEVFKKLENWLSGLIESGTVDPK